MGQVELPAVLDDRAITTMDAAEAAANPAAGIAASAASGAAPDIFGDLASQAPVGDVPWDLSAGQAAANPAGGLINGGLPGPSAGDDVHLFNTTSTAPTNGPLNLDSTSPLYHHSELNVADLHGGRMTL